MRKINVMVTGVGGGGVGEQVLKCLRLSSVDYFIIGGDMNRNSKGLLEVDIPYILPSAKDRDYVTILLEICRKHHVEALFPGSEPELLILSKNRNIFAQNRIYLPLNSQELMDICMDKHATMCFLKSNGFDVQKYKQVKKQEDLLEIDFFPVVLKPSIGGGGSVNTFIAQDIEELLLFGKYLLKIYPEFIVQEYIGNPDSEYTVGVLYNTGGGYINSIAVKKNIMSGLSNKTRVPNRTNRSSLGEYLIISSGVSQGEIGRFPEVTERCRVIAEKLGTTAAINIQCRIHENKLYVFEINPRISGTSSLRALVGYNEPDILIRQNILGEKIEADFAYQEGYIGRGLEEKFLSYDFMNGIEVAR